MLSIALLRSNHDWRVKGHIFGALFITSGFANYAQLQSYAAAIVAVYGGIFIIAGSCRQTSHLVAAVALLFASVAISTVWFVDAGTENTVNTFAYYLDKPHQTLFITAAYFMVIVIQATFILPIFDIVRSIKTNHEKIKENLLQQRQSAYQNREYIFTHLPGITIELDHNNAILTASRAALNLLNQPKPLGAHYASTWLATIKELPQLLHLTRASGASFQTTINNDYLPNGLYILQATSFLATNASHHTLLTIQKVKDELSGVQTEPLISQALQQYLAQIDIAFKFMSIAVLVPHNNDSEEGIQQPINQLLNMQETERAAQCQILESFDGAYFFITAHNSEREIRNFSDAIKLQQRHLPEHHNPFHIGLVTGRNLENNHSIIIAEAIKLKTELSTLAAPEFFERTIENLRDWDPSERLLLKNALNDRSLDLQLSRTHQRSATMAPLLEIKLLWKIPRDDFPHSEDTLEAIERANLVGHLSLLQVPRWRPLIREGLACGNEHTLALRLPKFLLNDNPALTKFKNELGDRPWYANRVILRINEADARALAPEQWDILAQVKDIGFSFMLGEVGSGDSDIKLLVDDFFSSLQFSRSLVQQALDSEHAEHVFKTVLNMAKELGKPTLAKADNDQANIARLHNWGVDYVDTV